MEFNFDIKKAGIFQAVKYSRNPVFKWDRFLIKTFLVLFITVFLLFLYGFLSESFSNDSNSVFLGLSLIFFVLTVTFKLRNSFFNSKLKNPKIVDSDNLAEFLSFKTAQAVLRSIRFARAKKLSEIDSTILFYFLLADNPSLNFVFSRTLLDLKEVKRILKKELSSLEKAKFDYYFSEDFEKTLTEASKVAKKREHLRIEVGDVLTALARHNPVFLKILIEAKLKFEDIDNLTWWLDSLEKRVKKQKRWWDYPNLMKRGTLAKEWTAGYTVTLDKYSFDWTEAAKKQGFPEIIGHGSEIEQIERVLGRREYNNVLLIGQPGAGRKSIVQGLVLKSVLGQSLPDVNYKRVIQLDLSAILAEITDPEAVEANLDKVFQEATEAGNVILVIDEFHNFVGVEPGPGKIDISGTLSAYLHLPQFQLVAVTSFAGLHKNIEQNPSILNLFAKVEVSEVAEREVMMILENLTLSLERKYRLFVSYPALREIIALTKRFLPSVPFPKKAIDLLDDAMIYVKKSTKDKIVLPSHIAKIITEKTQVPVGEIEVKEKETLLNLEKLIHQRIINQHEAVREVSTALRRARSEVTVKKGPMGGFLFLGPTGVGKTETSKALSQIYFGSESRTIRLDMSEFQEVKDISRLIGGRDQEGLLTTKVREDPFSLILLDEIEKAHPNILNLFLQVLDEGFVTDGLGRKVDFKNSIIIATSNAGYPIILQALKEKSEWPTVKQKLLDHIFEKAIFRPEFINRFDAVIVFRPLSKENLLDIAELMLRGLGKNLREKGIDLVITLPLKEKIVELGYDPTFGARQMRRVIQDKIENVLAQAILSGELQRGNKVEVAATDFSLKIK